MNGGLFLCSVVCCRPCLVVEGQAEERQEEREKDAVEKQERRLALLI